MSVSDAVDVSWRTPLLEAVDEEHAVEQLHRLGCTDGLPVIVPTETRVDRMVLAGGMPGEVSLGSIGPLGGNATVEAVAVCAVMAGCLPDYFPVVLAAAKGLCDPLFDIDEIQATTHDAGPMVIVNGPARFDFGPFESGPGALGPGNRANATVGRAVRLCLLNIGGGRPGTVDMALFGQPGKYTFCLAEAEEESPFAPLHTRLGYAADQSTVTMVNVESPRSVICGVNENLHSTSERLLHQLGEAVGNPSTNNGAIGQGDVVVILNPGHAQLLSEVGLGVADISQRISELTRKPRRSLHHSAQIGLDPEEIIAVPAENILIMVAGGPGVYSKVVPSWALGAHRNRHVVVEIVDGGAACAVPAMG